MNNAANEIARKYGTKIKDCDGSVGTDAIPANKAKALAEELTRAGFPAITERSGLALQLYVILR